jgi:hypothetical protein
MKRRDFLMRIGGAMVAVPVVLVATACGDDDDGGGGNADAAAATSFMSSSVGGDHTHALTIQCTDLSGSGDVTYTSSSGGGHTHQVTITRADLTTIMGGGTATVMITDLGHDHTWMITKPSSAC